jgi:hypothetical protein
MERAGFAAVACSPFHAIASRGKGDRENGKEGPAKTVEISRKTGRVSVPRTKSK